MTPDRSTLLGVIVETKAFSRHKEALAVEALGHILSISEAARTALSDVVDAGGKPVGPIHSVRTQVRVQDGGKPDLTCYDKNRRKRILIEAKFKAGLTEKQPVAYLKELPDGQPSALLFVAPASRIESLWTELRRRISRPEASARAAAGIWTMLRRGLRRIFGRWLIWTFHKNGVSWAPVGGAHRLMLTSWRHLLDRMEARVAASADSQTETHLRQLRDVANEEVDCAR